MQHVVGKSLAAVCLAAGLVWSGGAGAQGADPLAGLSWLTGAWQSSGPGGDIEAWYMPEHNGEILDTFTIARGGKIVRYEFRRIYVGKDGKVHWRELAWGPNLASVPKVPLMTLRHSDATHADFGRLALEKTGPNTMVLSLTLRGKDGKPQMRKFTYTRKFSFKAP